MKGQAFERVLCKDIQREIFDELGIEVELRRNLEQYRAAEQGDIQGMEQYGWTVEAKRYASNAGGNYKPDWWKQVCAAANANGTQPVLIYKYDRQPIKCVVRLSSINSDFAGKDNTATISFQTWCMIVREDLADEKSGD